MGEILVNQWCVSRPLMLRETLGAASAAGENFGVLVVCQIDFLCSNCVKVTQRAASAAGENLVI